MSGVSPPTTPNQVFIGTFIHPAAPNELSYLHDAAVFVDGPTGKIVAIEPATARQDVLERLGWTAETTHVHDPSSGASSSTKSVGKQFFFPGLIDTHIHASQYPNVGIFGKSTLLDWLNTYTFPLEASLGKDLGKARKVYGRVVRKTLSHGTTTATYFATTDVEATNILADVCLSAGQRALIGRVCMDEARMCPAWYRDESAEESVERTRAVVAYVQGRDPGAELVRPIITPRFAPSCTPAAMRALGDMARAEGLAVQTHVSENTGECELVAEMFPEETKDGKGYVGVYEAFGLLGERTILAHAVHLSEQEVKIVAETGSGVSHCPCSNTAITSGTARVRWLLDRGVDVGLGTDVSGGYSPSVLEAARQASMVSRHVALGLEGEEKERAKLTVEEVLWLATRGGAKLVGLEGRVGGFEVGMEWDALLVNLGGVGDEGEGDDGNVDVFGWESWEECVAKWLFNGDDRNLRQVWVRGRLVHERV